MVSRGPVPANSIDQRNTDIPGYSAVPHDDINNKANVNQTKSFNQNTMDNSQSKSFNYYPDMSNSNQNQTGDLTGDFYGDAKQGLLDDQQQVD